MLQAVGDDMNAIGIDHRELFTRLRAETRARLSKAIASGEKLALGIKPERQPARAG